MDKILFWGGTGQCKVMKPIADRVGKLTVILDNTEGLESPYDDVPIYNGEDCFVEWREDTEDYKDYMFCITIGNPHAKIRRNLSKLLIDNGLQPISLIHHSSIIEEDVEIGEGVQIHSGVVVQPFSKIGDYCILNTKSLVEHDCILHSGVELAPGVILCGNIEIEENTWIGAGCTIRQNIKIGKNCIIGAGSMVIDDIPDNQKVVGVPAKKFLK